MKPFSLVFGMTGIGILMGILMVLGCMMIGLIAAHPWITIVISGAIYGVIGLTIEIGKS